MFASRTTPVRSALRNFRPAARIITPSARISRSYATTRTKTSTTPPPSGNDGGLGQTLFLIAATLTIGGIVMSQRGKVTNEASVAAARAKAGDGSGRDRKRVEEPFVKDEEPKTADVPAIVTKKEEEAEQSTQEASSANQGAFNEETGEINWDCPCLGGMADGPCGEDFKAAFSCFVYSEAEPKGVDCVEKFKGMQDCFRLHPEIYGEEIDDDEQANADGPSDPDAGAGGEEIGSVDGPSTKAEPVKVDAESAETSSSA